MRRRPFGILLLYRLITFAIITLFYIRFVSSFQNVARATLEDMIYGQANKPFVYRALAPAVVRLVTAAIPLETLHHMNQIAARDATLRQIFSSLHWNPDYFLEHIITVFLTFLLLLAFMPAVRYLIQSVFHATPRFTAAVSLASVIFLIAFMGTRYTNYVYDFPTLILFTLGLSLLARER